MFFLGNRRERRGEKNKGGCEEIFTKNCLSESHSLFPGFTLVINNYDYFVLFEIIIRVLKVALQVHLQRYVLNKLSNMLANYKN